jgi:surface antigen
LQQVVRRDRYSRSAATCEGARRCTLLLALGLTLVTAGCSLSIPINPAADDKDDIPTGSIKPTADAPALSSRLGPEDWRRARSALAVALDPVGNGSRAVWENPASGLSGSFTPTAAPYVKADEVCRAFNAELTGQGDADSLEGVACRVSADEWSLKQVRPRKA